MGFGIGGLIGGIGGALLGGPAGAAVGASIGGGFDTNSQNAASAASAQDFSQQQYATRYQTQVADMKAAGLNPMLSYQQSPGSSPSGVTYQAQNPYAGAGSVYASSANVGKSGNLMDSQANASNASAGQANAQTNLINQTTEKVKQEVENMPKGEVNGYSVSDWAKIIMSKSAGLIVSQDLNQQSQSSLNAVQETQLRAVVNNLAQQTELGKLDVQAAKSLGNIGREAGQLKPIIDIILSVLRSRH